ncbi:hypothetical protein C8J57DRAFT_1725484 [Mycena rebaudengoi]|nr:hypothetical protein C8J57DRAFT_1725484 [Mycena rebaudengoi]
MAKGVHEAPPSSEARIRNVEGALVVTARSIEEALWRIRTGLMCARKSAEGGWLWHASVAKARLSPDRGACCLDRCLMNLKWFSTTPRQRRSKVLGRYRFKYIDSVFKPVFYSSELCAWESVGDRKESVGVLQLECFSRFGLRLQLTQARYSSRPRPTGMLIESVLLKVIRIAAATNSSRFGGSRERAHPTTLASCTWDGGCT